MKAFSKKQLLDGYIDCSVVGIHEVQLMASGSSFIVKHYEHNDLISKLRCDTYRGGVRAYADKIAELNTQK
jgi:hypothetical protein